MNSIVMTQCDTAPGLIIVLFDKATSVSGGIGVGASLSLNNAIVAPTTTPTVVGHLDLSDARVSVLCTMRLSDDTTSSIFSCFAQKIGTGADGGVYLPWPFFATDVTSDNYQIETTICWGIRTQTVIDIIPVYIREQFPGATLIADDENVAWRGGKLYIRNTDTFEVHGVSITGSTIPTIELSEGALLSSVSTTVTTVTVRIIDGKLYFKNTTDSYWRELTLTGDPQYLEIGNPLLTVNAGGTEDIRLATSRGRLLMKNLGTNKWHEITIVGLDGAQTINIGDGETI